MSFAKSNEKTVMAREKLPYKRAGSMLTLRRPLSSKERTTMIGRAYADI